MTSNPLTAKQLIMILIVVGLVVWGVLEVRSSGRKLDHSNAISTCLLNAPIGWDCDTNPTGYPQ